MNLLLKEAKSGSNFLGAYSYGLPKTPRADRHFLNIRFYAEILQ